MLSPRRPGPILPQTPAEPVGDLVERLGEALPAILAAAALVLAGFVLAWLVRTIAVRLVGPWGSRLAALVGRLLRNRDVEEGLRRTSLNQSVGATLGAILYWIVLLFFLAAATEALGLGVISQWLGSAAGYLPRALATVVLVLLAVVAGSVVRSAVLRAGSGAGLGYSSTLARLAQAVVVLVGIVIGFEQLGLEITFLVVLAAVVAGGLLGGAAIAFGLGSQTVVGNIVSSHYLTRIYRVGHRVRIDDIEGPILEITPTFVVIGSAEGRVVVPARVFSEKPATILAGEQVGGPAPRQPTTGPAGQSTL